LPAHQASLRSSSDLKTFPLVDNFVDQTIKIPLVLLEWSIAFSLSCKTFVSFYNVSPFNFTRTRTYSCLFESDVPSKEDKLVKGSSERWALTSFPEVWFHIRTCLLSLDAMIGTLAFIDHQSLILGIKVSILCSELVLSGPKLITS